MRLNRLGTAWAFVSAALIVGVVMGAPAQAQQTNPPVVIAEVYGGGGNSGAPYQNDYVVLFNRSTAPVSLAGWSVQYASATGTGNFANNPVVAVSGSLAPGQYYLVQLSGGAAGVPLPAPNATGSISASGTSGKFVLVASNAGLACNGGSTPCSAAQLAQIVDLVGYGSANFFEGSPAPTLSNTTAAIRAGNGCTDTNNNAADFVAGAPTPRNTLSPLSPCAAPPPVINEFSASTVGTDVEYVEIFGSPNTDYSAYKILEIEGDAGTAVGTIDEVISLGTTDANGLYLVNLPANALENGTITLLLVRNFTGALNDDLDTNNDGVFDLTPWAAIVDAVAVNDGGAGDLTYGVPVLGVAYDGLPFAPGGASRIPDGVDTDTAADWVRNDFDLAGIPGFVGTLVPGEAVNTPGASNSLVLTDAAPTVSSVVPTGGATGVAPNTNLVVTFSEPVNVTGAWFSLNCSGSGSVVAAVTGGPTTFTIDPSLDFEAGETCDVTIVGANVRDQDAIDPPDTMAANYSWAFSVAAADPCALPFTPIPAIQGTGATVAIPGQVTTQGVVVGDYEGASPALRGFFIQDPLGDGDAATSNAIFVFNGSNLDSVSLGQVVRVTGIAGENQGQSQVSVLSTNIRVCGTGVVEPTEVTFPVPSDDYLERYEGMLVRLPQTMYVTEHFQLGRFGQVVLSSGGRLAQPTEVVLPGAPAQALQAANSLNRIIVDDASQAQNPDPIVFGRGGLPLSASNTLRGGDTVTGLVGVLNYTWAGNAASGNAYRIRPVSPLAPGFDFQPANPRPLAAPEVGGTVRVANANVLNYYNTFSACTAGVIGDPIDCRGAENLLEFERQAAKTVAALLSTEADVIGLIEIENDGYGPGSAIQDLVNRLNEAAGAGTWAFIDADAGTGVTDVLGSDGIRVGLIYKPAVVTPVGQTAVLNTGAFGLYVLADGRVQGRNRPSLAQTFEVANGARATVVVNHLVSKGAGCDLNVSPIGPDPDTGDGQGLCNITRTTSMQELLAWLGTDPTGAGDPDYLLVGDFNAYDQEDPLAVAKAQAYTSLVKYFGGDGTYSYAFDGQWGSLDHTLASPTLLGQVTGAGAFHINADEPGVLDYNTNFKSAGQIVSLYAPDMYRTSDHDPLLVGLALSAAPVVSAGGPYTVILGQSVTVSATGYDPEGGPVTYAWDLDNDGSFETPGQTAVFSNTSVIGSYTVRVRATDNAGQFAIASATVNVVFNWTGFFPPVKNHPAVNAAKAGSAVPLKFSLGGDQGLAVFAAGYPVSVPVDCVTGATAPGSPTANPGGSGLTYDASTDQYTYVWKTQKSWAGTCRIVSVMLVDGTTHEAYFTFK